MRVASLSVAALAGLLLAFVAFADIKLAEADWPGGSWPGWGYLVKRDIVVGIAIFALAIAAWVCRPRA